MKDIILTSLSPLLIVGLIGLYWLWGQLRMKSVRNWPVVEGIITSSEVRIEKDGEGGELYLPVVVYRYVVNGLESENDRIKFGFRPTFPSPAEAEKFLSHYPVGASVRVHYNPRYVREATLQTEIPEAVITSRAMVLLVVAFILLLPLGACVCAGYLAP